MAFVSTSISDYNSVMQFFFLCVIPLESWILFILVLASSIIALCNTDKWVSTDKCCNLMRSNPACCSKCCGGNKHSCARLSALYIATSVHAGISFFIAGVALISGAIRCNDDFNYQSYDSDTFYQGYYGAQRYYSRRPVCVQLFSYQFPSLIFLFFLVGITARLARSIRQIENNQPDIAVLPPTKMITLRVTESMTAQSIVVDDIANVDNERTTTESATEVIYPLCIVSS